MFDEREIDVTEAFMNGMDEKIKPPRAGRQDIALFRSSPPPEEALMAWGDRPVDLTQEKLNVLFKAIRSAVSRDTAARKARISPVVITKWLERGLKEPDGWYGRFREEYLYMDALHESKYASRIDKASRDPKNWKAAETLLKVRHESWREKPLTVINPQQNNYTVIASKPEVQALNAMALDEFEALAGELLADDLE
jgi:hypothetical protein